MEWNIEKPKEEFTKHIELEDNNRIIFSGIFGIGKTYFLDKYFKENEKYNVIHLYPVNYSVAKNEDIFELVKYDIFYELLTSDKINFKEVNSSYFQTLPKYILNNSHNILAPFIKLLPVIGRSAFDIYENLLNLTKGAIEDNEKKSESKEDKIINFIDKINKENGTIYESNSYTDFISNLLDEAKDTNEEISENILIIDDLDRVEPEHIFRLLNIFAAHFDNKNGRENKFGFDKIILVFDINNVRKIFANKYGGDVDFSGYIDKFYSQEVFYFDNSKAVINALDEYFISLKKSDSKQGYKFIEDDVDFSRVIIQKILILFINNKQVNLRSLIKLVNHERKHEPFLIKRRVSSNNLQAVFVFNFFEKLFGNKDKFLMAFQSIHDIEIDSYDIPGWVEHFIIWADYKNHLFSTNKVENPYIFLRTYNGIKSQKYSISDHYSQRDLRAEIAGQKETLNLEDIPYLLKDASVAYYEIIELYRN